MKRIFVLLVLVVALGLMLTACAKAPANVAEAMALGAVPDGHVVLSVGDSSGDHFNIFVCSATDSKVHQVYVNTVSAAAPEANDQGTLNEVVCGDMAKMAYGNAEGYLKRISEAETKARNLEDEVKRYKDKYGSY